MIVIIKKGTREVTTCNTCGCKFSYEKEDVKNGDTDNYKRWKEYVVCPQCSCEVILKQTRQIGRCEGDFICSELNELVIVDWVPVYGACVKRKKKDLFNQKKRKKIFKIKKGRNKD